MISTLEGIQFGNVRSQTLREISFRLQVRVSSFEFLNALNRNDQKFEKRDELIERGKPAEPLAGLGKHNETSIHRLLQVRLQSPFRKRVCAPKSGRTINPLFKTFDVAQSIDGGVRSFEGFVGRLAKDLTLKQF